MVNIRAYPSVWLFQSQIHTCLPDPKVPEGVQDTRWQCLPLRTLAGDPCPEVLPVGVQYGGYTFVGWPSFRDQEKRSEELRLTQPAA